MSDIQKRIENIQKIILKSKRPITLIAVSKGQSLQKIKEAIEAGITLFAENYVQEFLEKWNVIGNKVTWFFIGHLQTNKVKYIIDKVSMIQTIDSLKLFQTIDKNAQRISKKMPVLIEVNIGEEKSKSGILPQELPLFLKSLSHHHLVDIQGFMAIPPYFEDPKQVRPYFKKLFLLKEEMQHQFPHLSLKELSMGMTHDFHIAIEEGTTQIRIGEGIFGPRSIDISKHKICGI